MFRTRQRSAKTPAKGEEMTIARLKTIRTYARARCIDALHCSARRAADQPYALAFEEVEEQRRCERPPAQPTSTSAPNPVTDCHDASLGGSAKPFKDRDGPYPEGRDGENLAPYVTCRVHALRDCSKRCASQRHRWVSETLPEGNTMTPTNLESSRRGQSNLAR